MNWKNIKHLTEDDYGKPLLFKMPYPTDVPTDGFHANCFTGEIVDGDVYDMNHMNGYVHNVYSYIMTVAQLPDDTCYLRIDEIKD